MKFVSYYTSGPYKEVIETYLKPSLDKWDLDYHIEEIPDFGSWAENTSYKSVFISKMLEKFQEDLVFLDADADIVQYPKLLFNVPKQYDMAVHFLDWNLHWRNKTSSKRELLSGTMFIRYNPKMVNLINIYISECKSNIGKWEQRILQEILEIKKDINIYKLPVEYCAVIKHDNKLPSYIKDPVIVHNQVSRKHKNRRREDIK